MQQKLEAYSELKVDDEDHIKSKLKMQDRLKQIQIEINKIVDQPENIVPFLVPGRVIKIQSDGTDWGWGILASFSKQKISAKSR